VMHFFIHHFITPLPFLPS